MNDNNKLILKNMINTKLAFTPGNLRLSLPEKLTKIDNKAIHKI